VDRDHFGVFFFFDGKKLYQTSPFFFPEKKILQNSKKILKKIDMFYTLFKQVSKDRNFLWVNLKKKKKKTPFTRETNVRAGGGGGGGGGGKRVGGK